MAFSATVFAEKLKKSFDDLDKIMFLAATYGCESQKDWKQYAASAERLCEIERKVYNHNEALKEASRESCKDSFYRRYNAETSKRQTNVKKLARYKQFVSSAKELLAEHREAGSSATQDDDEDVVIEEATNSIDPISKRPIEIPVRNKCCNHVYDKNSIEQLLAANKNTRCPVMGCAATTYVTQANLVVDKRMHARLLRERVNDV